MDPQISLQEMEANAQHLRGAVIQDAPHPSFRHEVVIPSATYAPWASDPEFLRVYELIQQNTMVDKYRCHELWSLVSELSSVQGDILEVGVWRGGTGCLIAVRAQQLAPEKRVFLCDTFSGVVKAGADDTYYRGGEHADASGEVVQSLLARAEVTNVTILEGIFPDQTGDPLADRRLSFSHIDVDVYRSARDILDWVWPRMQVGGAVVFDDFGFLGCEGVTKLVQERTCRPDSLMIHNLNGHALLLKIA
jgi:O-methyltransferase